MVGSSVAQPQLVVCDTPYVHPPPVLSERARDVRLTEMWVIHRTSPLMSLDANVDYYERDCH